MRHRSFAAGLAGCAAAALLALPGAAQAQGARVVISCGAVGQELALCQEGAQAWAASTGNTVEVVSTPNSATERLALYQQFLAARSPDIDVYQIDVIWPGLLGGHFEDMNQYVDEATVAAHFPSIVQNNTVGGRLVAMPWYTDAGVLYYRADLLEKHGREVPETWEELTETARLIMEAERAEGRPTMQGYVFQGRAYEGLTCNALEWIHSFGGGTIVGSEGDTTVDNPQAVEAIRTAASWIGSIAPQGVLNYAEEESRGVFQSGDAVFMRNWPYAWALAQGPDSPVRGKVGVAPLPHGPDGESAATLGGWQLAVSRYSANKQAAADLVRYLTSAEEQKRRAMAGSYLPTIEQLYQDQEIVEAAPLVRDMYDALVGAVARPSSVTGERYNQVSAEFFGAVHAALSGRTEPEAAMTRVDRQLERLSRGGRW